MGEESAAPVTSGSIGSRFSNIAGSHSPLCLCVHVFGCVYIRNGRVIRENIR